MPRPQKYSDSEIVEAIQSLVAEGRRPTISGVRMRLGGGNPDRIKAILEESLGPPSLVQGSGGYQRLSEDAAQQFQALVARCWSVAQSEAGAMTEVEDRKWRQALDELKAKLEASAGLLSKTEEERDQLSHALEEALKHQGNLERQCADLKAALRNAESDLKGMQRTADSFERNQRLDREEVRGLQKRIETLVAEVAVLKADRPRAPKVVVNPGRGRRRSPVVA
jgi:hypothetical protein